MINLYNAEKTGLIEPPWALFLYAARCEQRQVPCPFNGHDHLPLLLGRNTRNPAGNNLSPLIKVFLQYGKVLIIDISVFRKLEPRRIFLAIIKPSLHSDFSFCVRSFNQFLPPLRSYD